MLIRDEDKRTKLGRGIPHCYEELENCSRILNTCHQAWQDKRKVEHLEHSKLARKLVAEKLFMVAQETISMLADELGELEMAENLSKLAYHYIQDAREKE